MPLEEFESAEPGLCAQIPRSARPGRQRHGHKIHKAMIFFHSFSWIVVRDYQLAMSDMSVTVMKHSETN